jgi:hypothetical protein
MAPEHIRIICDEIDTRVRERFAGTDRNSFWRSL